jgi:hypothetical protein
MPMPDAGTAPYLERRGGLRRPRRVVDDEPEGRERLGAERSARLALDLVVRLRAPVVFEARVARAAPELAPARVRLRLEVGDGARDSPAAERVQLPLTTARLRAARRRARRRRCRGAAASRITRTPALAR